MLASAAPSSRSHSTHSAISPGRKASPPPTSAASSTAGRHSRRLSAVRWGGSTCTRRTPTADAGAARLLRVLSRGRSGRGVGCVAAAAVRVLQVTRPGAIAPRRHHLSLQPGGGGSRSAVGVKQSIGLGPAKQHNRAAPTECSVHAPCTHLLRPQRGLDGRPVRPWQLQLVQHLQLAGGAEQQRNVGCCGEAKKGGGQGRKGRGQQRGGIRAGGSATCTQCLLPAHPPCAAPPRLSSQSAVCTASPPAAPPRP